ncbi:unnamed protein product [Adineta steineri]|uniref:NAD(P)(+)--arginine ADP-ribosyltransferase n=1 Tax=Adineta steineri TaxID=433720 RepID=A0A815Q1T5_9BILA|nr:unnamed protein product [Adineta steineri]CAF1449943.1 unnamed protein product [Adineta steineri]CAF1457417.1 unnamed protein product [Adineta steineri]CAF3637711.1 unnamed protein product [Adineta steineri]CAF3718862.1 unnamed protein product [Adineta steineri]
MAQHEDSNTINTPLNDQLSVNILEWSDNEQRVTYMYNKLLRYILLHMPHTDASKGELFENIKAFTVHGTPNEQHMSDKFVREYTGPEQAVRWYTVESFLFRQLNDSLRDQNIKSLYGMRYFLVDLHQQLQKLHLNFDRKQILYRGVMLRDDIVDKLRAGRGKLLHFSHFVSTSTSEDIAKGFTRAPAGSQKAVLFSINIGSNADTIVVHENPIACIEKLSERPLEKEVLLAPGLIFQLKDVKPLEQSLDAKKKSFILWKVQLELISDDVDTNLKKLYQSFKEEIYIDERYPTNLANLSKLLRRLDQFDLAITFYQKALVDPPLNSDAAYRTTIFTDLSLIYRQKKDYANAMKELDKAAESAKNIKNLLPFDRPYRIIMSNRAIIYKYMENFDSACQCLIDTLEMENKAKIGDTQERATTLNNLASLQMSAQRYDDAMQNFHRVLDIQQKVLPSDHPEIGRTYSNMAACCNCMNSSTEAKEYGNKAEFIKSKSLPSNHQSVAVTHIELGMALKNLGQSEQAYGHLEEAAEILTQRYPRTDPVLQSLEEAKDSLL